MAQISFPAHVKVAGLDLSFNPTSVDFGDLAPGSVGARDVTVTNNSTNATGTLTYGLSAGAPAGATVTGDGFATMSLNAGASRVITFRVSIPDPSVNGDYNFAVTLTK